MTIQRVPLNVLHQPDLNVRKHTDKQIAEYVRSLRMFGQVKPIIVDENYEIICGNGLYLALMQMSEAECDCYVITGLTPSQKKKLMLTAAYTNAAYAAIMWQLLQQAAHVQGLQ